MFANRINKIYGLRGGKRLTVGSTASTRTIFDSTGSRELNIEIVWKHITKEELENICYVIAEGEGGQLVKTVHLSDNELGPTSSEKIISALSASAVQEVLLCFNDIGREGCDALSDAVNISVNLRLLDIRGNGLNAKCVNKLLKAVSSSMTLVRLGLASNKLGEEGAMLVFRALEKNTFLTSLDLSLNEIGPGGAKSIAKLLEIPDSALKCVQLYGNYLGPSGVAVIALAVRRNRSLKQLTLGNNNATDEAAVQLAEMLSENSTLERLDLRLNVITAVGIRTLAQEGLGQNGSLLSLSLAGNPIGSVGGEEISQSLILSQVTALSVLDLSSCQLGPTGGMRVANLIATSSTITDVNLSDNKLDDEASVSIANSIINGLSISMLNLSRNEIGEWSACNLIEAIQRNYRMVSLNLHGNKINRTVQKKIDSLIEDRLNDNNSEHNQWDAPSK
uniref:WGS project CAEQ00000000 data, annotated contig 1169 n=1 Tax=Trypanosoma congolense (strain IL3000) TaxID=1068625 RepID=F9W4C7_TRYCI|nr:unnamed protein product [Trypanosoma congolense IL3000]